MVGEVAILACPTTVDERVRVNDEFALLELVFRPATEERERISTSNAAALENAEAADRLEATFSRTSNAAGSVGIKCKSRLIVS